MKHSRAIEDLQVAQEDGEGQDTLQQLQDELENAKEPVKHRL